MSQAQPLGIAAVHAPLGLNYFSRKCDHRLSRRIPVSSGYNTNFLHGDYGENPKLKGGSHTNTTVRHKEDRGRCFDDPVMCGFDGPWQGTSI
jgi:hypothetical protein